MRRLLSILTLALAAGIVLPAASARAATASAGSRPAGSFGVRLFDVPVADAHNPRALRYIIDYLHPGAVIHRRILVLNSESRTVRFTVYADAAKIARGAFTGDAGATRSELTTWIRVARPVLRLRPGTSALDMTTIRVPRHATRGEHYGVIWAQQSALRRDSAGAMVREIARVGIRIYLAVGRGGAPPTRFRITSLTGRKLRDGQPVLVTHVADTGGRAVDLAGTASLSGGPGGASVRAVTQHQALTLAPGQSGNLTFDERRDLPGGPWQARVKLASGLTTAIATAQVDFASPAGGLPWDVWLPGLLLGLLLLYMAVLRYRPQAGRRAAARRAWAPQGYARRRRGPGELGA